MRLMHLCLCGPYSDEYEYQDNLLPMKHHEMGYEVKVLVSQETWGENGVRGLREPQTYINKYNYEITVLPFKKNKFAYSYRMFEGLYDAIKEFQPDIIFCHGGLTFDYLQIVKYLKANTNVKFFLDSHMDFNISGLKYLKGFHYYMRLWLYKYVWGHCIRKLSIYATKVWGVTPARVDFLKQVFMVNPVKVDLLVMGGDEKCIDYDHADIYRSQLRKKCHIEEQDLLIVTGGKLDRYKNIQNLIKAVKNLEGVHLAIFGSPDEEMKKIFEKEISTVKNVTMLGWATSEQISEYFLGADLAVFPGRHSVLWEQAVLCGIPCVFLFAKGMQHVDVGGNCLFFKDDTIETIEEMIVNIKENRTLLNSMKEIATTKGREVFSYCNIAKRSIEIGENDVE